MFKSLATIISFCFTATVAFAQIPSLMASADEDFYEASGLLVYSNLELDEATVIGAIQEVWPHLKDIDYTTSEELFNTEVNERGRKEEYYVLSLIAANRELEYRQFEEALDETPFTSVYKYEPLSYYNVRRRDQIGILEARLFEAGTEFSEPQEVMLNENELMRVMLQQYDNKLHAGSLRYLLHIGEALMKMDMEGDDVEDKSEALKPVMADILQLRKYIAYQDMLDPMLLRGIDRTYKFPVEVNDATSYMRILSEEAADHVYVFAIPVPYIVKENSGSRDAYTRAFVTNFLMWDAQLDRPLIYVQTAGDEEVTAGYSRKLDPDILEQLQAID